MTAERVKRLIALVLALAYLSIGMRFAYALHSVVPAINMAGETYVALTWPFWLKVSPVDLPIPEWAFTFNGAR